MNTARRISDLARSRAIDAAAIMTIKSLELRARVVVEGLWNGLHRSPYHGFSVEFTEYREYTPGDDPRHLDWRLYARSDRYYIKKFEDETNLRCYLAVDKSASMNYRSGRFSKADYAKTLAATFGYFLTLQGDAVGLATFDSRILNFLPPRSRPAHFRQIAAELEREGGKLTDLNVPLQRLAGMIRKRGLIVLISDLLADLEGFERNLLVLSAAGHEVVVFQTLDPRELDFAFENEVVFRDLETERDLYVNPAAAREAYLQKLTAHNQQVRRVCQRMGAGHYLVSTEQPFTEVLRNFLNDRLKRGKKVRGRNS